MSLIQALGWSLLHFLWQGAAAAAVLASLNLLLRRASTSTRYLLASVTLLLMVMLPVGTFLLLSGSEPAAADAAWGPAEDAVVAPSPVAAPPEPASDLRRRIEPLLPALVALWGAGALVLSLRVLGGWVLVQRLKRSGLSLPSAAIEQALERLVGVLRVSAPVRVFESALVQVPTAVGWLRPVILLPASAVTGLSPEQIELVLAHELAHIRRLDYLVNLVQTAAETLLFYHPAVWWVSHRMRVERENCCDDLAVGACGGPVRYAKALAHLERLRSDGLALAMAASGGSLFARIARLVGAPQHVSRSSRGLGALLAAVSLGAALGAASLLIVRPAPAAALALALPPDDDPAAAPAPAPQTPERQRQPPQPPQPEPRAFPLERVLEMARAGITPEFIDEMDALGYRSVNSEQLVTLRSQGVSPDYVRALAEAGYQGLSVDQLLSLRSQGVSAAYARGLQEQGLADLSVSDLIALRAQGVSPELAAELRKAGYDRLSVSKLVALRSQGVSGAYVAELKALGYERLSFSKLLALRSQGVTPEYVRELAELGYRGLEVPILIGLRSQGVTPEYVRGLKEAGYAGLPAGMLIALRSQGVTPAFIRELKEAGFLNLKPEELIELRAQGVRGELLKRLQGRQ